MSTVKSRRDQFSAATRAALLEAATRRFATLGFAGTGLEDIAADIQATRGAVYHHFPSKKALFEAVFEQLEISAVQRSQEAGDAGADAWQSALLALDMFLEICADPVYGRVVWLEAPIALGWARWEELENKFAYGLIEQHVHALIEGGHIDPMPLDTTTRIVYAMLGAAGLALGRAEAEEKPRVQEEFRAVIGRLLAGMATSPR
jgi:AcrR family transcriptional regulator